MRKVILALSILTFVPASLFAAAGDIKFSLSSAFSGAKTILAVSSDGKAKSTSLAAGAKSGKISLPTGAKSAFLYLLSDGEVTGQFAVKTCTKASNYTKCNANRVATLIKKNANLKKVKVTDSDTQTLLSTIKGTNYTKSVVPSVTVQATAGQPLGIATHGLNSSGSTIAIRNIRALADAGDQDGDGLAKEVDADDDGDSILDNYDSDSTNTPSNTSFRIFSNFKLDIANSLNLHATGLTTSAIDTAMQSTQSLAIEVAGNSGDTTELNCGTLGYCSSGGTGQTDGGAFPGTVGSSPFDSDGDGFGTITKGGTGDFQLRTGATTSSIGAGDTLIEVVTDSASKETQIPGMLNFVFHSTPALKSIAVNDDAATTLNYSAFPLLGSRDSCVVAPATGDVSITVTVWRPQRPGESSAGESEYVDLGNSLYTADIPNGPCDSPNSGCSTSGPGNCAVSSYDISADSNLSISGDAVKDGKADQNADSANTLTFKINLSNCLNNAAGGAIAWAAGKTLFVDLQAKSSAGDNSAQKFCVSRNP